MQAVLTLAVSEPWAGCCINVSVFGFLAWQHLHLLPSYLHAKSARVVQVLLFSPLLESQLPC